MVLQFLINYAFKSKWLKILTSFVSFSIISFSSIVLFSHEVSKISLGAVIDLILKNLNQYVGMLLTLSVGIMMFQQFFYVEWIFFLELTHKKSLISKECYQYLDILD